MPPTTTAPPAVTLPTPHFGRPATARQVAPCTIDPDKWSSGDPTDQFEALIGCLGCPRLAACRAETVDALADGFTITGVVQGGVAFTDTGAADISIHGPEGAARLTEALELPEPGGPVADELDALTDEQIAANLAAAGIPAAAEPAQTQAKTPRKVKTPRANPTIRISRPRGSKTAAAAH